MPYNSRALPAYSFIGTLYNLDWQFPSELPPTISYMAGQVERCPSTQRLHWQLFIKTEKKVRFSHVKKVLGQDTLDLTPVTSTEFKARDYCKKDRTRVTGPFELGTYRGHTQVQDKKIHPLMYMYTLLRARPTTPPILRKQDLWAEYWNNYDLYKEMKTLGNLRDPIELPEDVMEGDWE